MSRRGRHVAPELPTAGAAAQIAVEHELKPARRGLRGWLPRTSAESSRARIEGMWDLVHVIVVLIEQMGGENYPRLFQPEITVDLKKLSNSPLEAVVDGWTV